MSASLAICAKTIYSEGVGKLLLLFTIVPLVELYLLVWVGRVIGFWATIGLVLLTGAVGAALARAEGLRVIHSWQQSLRQGRTPEEGVLGGVLVFAGGILLITPGILTDAVGLLLLLQPTRRGAVSALRKYIERRVSEGDVRVFTFDVGPRPSAPPSRTVSRPPPVIDVDGEEVEDESSRG